MTLFLDARMPLRIGTAETAGPDDALLIEGGGAVPEGRVHARFILPEAASHPSGCACCLPRGPVAEALATLFLRRVRGEVQFFPGVVAVVRSDAGIAAVKAALREDPMVLARFRLIPGRPLSE